ATISASESIAAAFYRASAPVRVAA
ncbi:MAG: hypothetical protein ACD_77C00096G0001, partial [uncultured bacterium]